MSRKPRVCDDCGLRTNKFICPRCGGQTDTDEYRVGDEPDDELGDTDDPDHPLNPPILED